MIETPSAATSVHNCLETIVTMKSLVKHLEDGLLASALEFLLRKYSSKSPGVPICACVERFMVDQI